MSSHLRPVEHVDDWIAPRFGDVTGRVGSTVPHGFAAYARILHPLEDAAGGPATWSDVAAFTGSHEHALMQFGAISRTPEWPGTEPEEGNLSPDRLERLCDVLDHHTPAEAECFFALWEGYGWVHGSPGVVIVGSDEVVPPAFPPEVLNGPRLRHWGGRDYLVFRGGLRAASEMGWRRDEWFDPQSPNLFWPADRSWCVATEIDFDSTLVAGSAELVDDVLAHPELEAWPVGPEDPLTVDGDHLNR